MLFPTIIADNFYSNPKEVLSFAKNLNYNHSKDGLFPGKRTAPLHTIDFNFFNFSCTKILSILYPNDYKEINFEASILFQLINTKNYDLGWIHKDDGLFTAIIYLSEDETCGTNIYDRINNSYVFEPIHTEIKHESFKNFENIEQRKKNFEFAKNNNDLFKSTINIDSKFNRVLIFDSSLYHGAQNFKDSKEKKERLTLICFFSKLEFNNKNRLKFPLNENSILY